MQGLRGCIVLFYVHVRGLDLAQDPKRGQHGESGAWSLEAGCSSDGQRQKPPLRNGAEIFKEELTAMRNMVNCPGEAAAPAEVKAEAAGSPKQPQKPAETPRDAGGNRKRKRTSTPSRPTPLKQSMQMGRGRGAGGGRGKRSRGEEV